MKKLLTAFFALFTFCTIGFSQNYNISLRSKIEYPGQTLANVWTHSANGKEYALVGASKGMSIVDITDPDKPKEIKQLLDGIDNLWREIKTYKNFAYITTEGGGGLAIADLTNLPDTAIRFHKYIGDGEIDGKLGAIHALHVDTVKGFVYCYGTTGLANGGAVVLDLKADPFNPRYVGQYNLDYVHDGYVDNDTLYASLIYKGFAAVVDFRDKKNPVEIVRIPTPTRFTHNTWTTNDKKYLFTTDENTNSYLGSFDISDLSNVTLVDRIQPTPGSGSIVHNTYVRGNFAITSWYKDGFTITDVSRPENLVQVGQYDLYPQGVGSGFDGTWGVAPYLPSGNIVASNINEGGKGVCYIMTPTYVDACYLEGRVKDQKTKLALNGVAVTINSPDPLANTTTDPLGEFRTGQPTPGNFAVTFTKAGYRSKTINVSLFRKDIVYLNVELEPLGNLTVNTIKTTDNKPLANAKVLMKSADATYEFETDSMGRFEIGAFAPGDYGILAGKWGYDYAYETRPIVSGETINLQLSKKYRDDFELDYAWTTGGSASRGRWVRAVPKGTVYQNKDVNPAKDVDDDLGNMCYVTGNGGANPQDEDIDDGDVILTSPAMDLTSYQSPVIKYRLWFFQGGPFQTLNDSFIVTLSNGFQEVVLEKLTAAQSQWRPASVHKIKGLMQMTNNMKVTFRTFDQNPGNWVEGGVDQFLVDEATGIEEVLNEELTATTAPNPTQNTWMVDISNKFASQSLILEVFDMKGVLLESVQTNGQHRMEIGENLRGGIYSLRIRNKEMVGPTVKIVKF